MFGHNCLHLRRVWVHICKHQSQYLSKIPVAFPGSQATITAVSFVGCLLKQSRKHTHTKGNSRQLCALRLFGQPFLSHAPSPWVPGSLGPRPPPTFSSQEMWYRSRQATFPSQRCAPMGASFPGAALSKDGSKFGRMRIDSRARRSSGLMARVSGRWKAT